MGRFFLALPYSNNGDLLEILIKKAPRFAGLNLFEEVIRFLLEETQ